MADFESGKGLGGLISRRGLLLGATGVLLVDRLLSFPASAAADEPQPVDLVLDTRRYAAEQARQVAYALSRGGRISEVPVTFGSMLPLDWREVGIQGVVAVDSPLVFDAPDGKYYGFVDDGPRGLMSVGMIKADRELVSSPPMPEGRAQMLDGLAYVALSRVVSRYDRAENYAAGVNTDSAVYDQDTITAGQLAYFGK